MSIKDLPLIPDLRLFEGMSVSREHGRERMRDLMSEHVITPRRTPTGRCLLTIGDAEKLAKAL